jgi:hypothetical protein
MTGKQRSKLALCVQFRVLEDLSQISASDPR